MKGFQRDVPVKPSLKVGCWVLVSRYNQVALERCREGKRSDVLQMGENKIQAITDPVA